MRINENYRNIQDSYLFSTVGKKVAAYAASHPDARIIRLGIGDVTRPLCPAVIDALHRAVAEMGTPEGFHDHLGEKHRILRNEQWFIRPVTDTQLIQIFIDGQLHL